MRTGYLGVFFTLHHTDILYINFSDTFIQNDSHIAELKMAFLSVLGFQKNNIQITNVSSFYFILRFVKEVS